MTVQPIYEIEGEMCSLYDWLIDNIDDGELNIDITIINAVLRLEVGESIGEGVNMATIKRIS